MVKVMAFSLPEPLYTEIRAQAEAEERPYSWLATKAFSAYLAAQRQKDEEAEEA